MTFGRDRRLERIYTSIARLKTRGFAVAVMVLCARDLRVKLTLEMSCDSVFKGN